MAAKQTARTIRFMAPVEDVSAKFARVIDTCSNTTITGKQRHKWFGAALRMTNRQGVGVTSKQVFVYRKFPRVSAYGAEERVNQSNFAFASKWASDTLENLSLVSTIQQNFASGTAANGVSPRGYTLRGWVFVVRYQQKVADPTITPQSAAYNQWPS